MEKFETEKFEAPVELDDVELDAVAGGLQNDINFVVAVVNARGVRIVDRSRSDTDIPT
jgi:hypothetical protein